VHGAKAPERRRLHGQKGYDLKKVILDHVAQAAGRFVKRPATVHAKSLGESDLDAGHVVAVPDRFRE
jgi:hypothetical protein